MTLTNLAVKENMENNLKKEKTEINLSFNNSCNNELMGKNMIGSPLQLSPINSTDEIKFARFIGNTYTPRRPKKNEIISMKERLWMFLIIKQQIEKNKLLNLKFVKHSSLA